MSWLYIGTRNISQSIIRKVQLYLKVALPVTSKQVKWLSLVSFRGGNKKLSFIQNLLDARPLFAHDLI